MIMFGALHQNIQQLVRVQTKLKEAGNYLIPFSLQSGTRTRVESIPIYA
jgi:hypothetical protein